MFSSFSGRVDAAMVVFQKAKAQLERVIQDIDNKNTTLLDEIKKIENEHDVNQAHRSKAQKYLDNIGKVLE